MNPPDHAQVIGEIHVGILSVEVSELGIDVELQQERHPGVRGSLPDDDAISMSHCLGVTWCPLIQTNASLPALEA